MKRSVFYGYGFAPQASPYSELFRQVVERSWPLAYHGSALPLCTSGR